MAKTKYETHVKPRMKEIYKWAQNNIADKEIAGRLNIAYSTFREYIKKYPALSATLRLKKEPEEISSNNVLRLTDKQEKFVRALIEGKSQREAYKEAYPKSKLWSNKAVDTQASILMKNSKVLVRFNEIKGKVVAKAEEEAIMSALEVLREIESIAKTKMSDFLEFRTEKTVVGYNEKGKPIIAYAPIVDVKDSRAIDTKNISEISLGANGSFKFKTYCRDTALYKMLEVYGENAVAKAKQKLAEERFLHEKEIDKLKYF